MNVFLFFLVFAVFDISTGRASACVEYMSSCYNSPEDIAAEGGCCLDDERESEPCYQESCSGSGNPGYICYWSDSHDSCDDDSGYEPPGDDCLNKTGVCLLTDEYPDGCCEPDYFQTGSWINGMYCQACVSLASGVDPATCAEVGTNQACGGPDEIPCCDVEGSVCNIMQIVEFEDLGEFEVGICMPSYELGNVGARCDDTPGGYSECTEGYYCNYYSIDAGISDSTNLPFGICVPIGLQFSDLLSLIAEIGSVIYYVALVVGFGMIIVAGYKFIVSKGDPLKAKEAKESLNSALLGVLYVILSGIILNIVIDIILNG